MLYTISLYVSLIIFGLGLLYRLSIWFRRTIGENAEEISTINRVLSVFKGILGAIFSAKVFILLKVFVLDVILQRKILKENLLRWLMHICIYGGFMLLVFMHALDKLITSSIFNNYYSTINPFMFLRDFFALLVIIGLAVAIYRRFILKAPRMSTNAMDIYTIIIVSVIMVSGILLEGVKISSHTRYREMVEEYAETDNESELRSLEAYWVKEFSVVSPHNDEYFDSADMKLGKEIHEMSCSECHSNPKWAFTGYITAGVIKPGAQFLDEVDAKSILLIIHFLAVFFILSYMPFSKMFHIIATPISLLANAVMEEGKSDPANIATKQVMELDACTHCGTCSLRCSSLAAFEMIGNSNILPSEKMIHIKALVNGKKLNEDEIRSLQEGVYICTNCDRCTVSCPSGINLKDLWYQAREKLIQNGYPSSLVLSPFSFCRGLMKDKIDSNKYSAPLNNARTELTSKVDEIKSSDMVLSLSDLDNKFIDELGLSNDASTYSNCFSCNTCTSSCPVVQNYDNPMDVLGLLPHQIIHSAALGLKDLAIESRMLWDCLTCYKCEESCPQGVRITEVFYKLKSLSTTNSLENIKKDEVSTTT